MILWVQLFSIVSMCRFVNFAGLIIDLNSHFWLIIFFWHEFQTNILILKGFTLSCPLSELTLFLAGTFLNPTQSYPILNADRNLYFHTQKAYTGNILKYGLK